jgi:hypothetical protein
MASKTDMINLALLKLHGVTSGATQIIESAIADSVFADPSTASGTNKDDIRLYCTRYPFVLKKALRDIKPDFAKRYADLGKQVEITITLTTLVERGQWAYFFNLPTDTLTVLRQVYESDHSRGADCDLLIARDYAHVVKGDDEQAWYCSTGHVSVDDANDGQPPTDDGNGNWTLFNTDDAYGADWEETKAYLDTSGGKGLLLATSTYTNDGADSGSVPDSAYIEYLAYAQAGIGDEPDYYDEDFIEAFTTLLASEMAPWSDGADSRIKLRAEYENVAKHRAMAAQSDYEDHPGAEAWSVTRTRI